MVRGARRRREVFASHRAAIDHYATKPPLSILTPEALEAYVVHGFRADPEGVRLKCSPDTEASTFATGTRHDTWDRLPSIATPTVVIAGRVEESQPSAISAAIASRLACGRYVECGHLTHFGPMSHPAEVADLVADAVAG
jgi:pimeloyl-ACP methyl ester carboxylesterase